MTSARATKQNRPTPAKPRKREPLDLSATIKLMREMEAVQRPPTQTDTQLSAQSNPAKPPPSLGLVVEGNPAPPQQTADPEPETSSDLAAAVQSFKHMFSRKKQRAGSAK